MIRENEFIYAPLRSAGVDPAVVGHVQNEHLDGLDGRVNDDQLVDASAGRQEVVNVPKMPQCLLPLPIGKTIQMNKEGCTHSVRVIVSLSPFPSDSMI